MPHRQLPTAIAAEIAPTIEASLRQALSLPDISPMIRMVMAVTPKFEFGALTLVLPDGRRVRFRGRQPGPDAEWRFNDPRAAGKFFTGGAVAWAEAYMDGLWETPNLEALIEFFAKNDPAIEAMLQGKLWYRALRRMQHLLRRNSKTGSKRNIAYHYDLGNDFYATTMTHWSVLRRRSIAGSPRSCGCRPGRACWRSAAAGAVSPSLRRASTAPRSPRSPCRRSSTTMSAGACRRRA
jgi:hypothetical protein